MNKSRVAGVLLLCAVGVLVAVQVVDGLRLSVSARRWTSIEASSRLAGGGRSCSPWEGARRSRRAGSMRRWSQEPEVGGGEIGAGVEPSSPAPAKPESVRVRDERSAVAPSPVTDSYPIDFPSYGLLGLSGVVAIAFVGSIFEVTGPNPVLGYIPTYVVLVLSLPSFLFLFYAAIKKGQAEEKEDQEYY